MAKRKPQPELAQIKKPQSFDLTKGLAAVKRLVEENREWVKEMAAK